MSSTNNIGYLLQHLSGVLAKQSDQALQERLGIGFSQFKILRVLQENPVVLQKQIAEWLGQTEASISRQIKLMHETGLLHTVVNPRNRREHITSPTAKGMRLAEEALNVLNSTHASVFEELGEKHQEQLHAILSHMHKFSCQSGRIGACAHPYNA